MNFEIEVNGRPHAVKVERTGARYRIESDGRVDVVDVARVDRTTISMIVDGDRATQPRGVAARRARARRGRGLPARGRRPHPRRRRAGPAAVAARAASALGAAGGPQRVTAPMPGKIVKVLVKPGDHVTARQGLVVIEAMKMENELRAARDGQVKDVHVAEGDLVEAGRLLTVIE